MDRGPQDARMTPASAADTPGWYGKLATLGDFAQRRLPSELVRRCDEWLSHAMQASRQQLGERWLGVYLTAPVLRFAWAPGVVDAAWWFGVLMPSCDNVGRYFPLMVVQRRAQPPQDGVTLAHLDAWYAHIAHAATQTLGDGATLARFEQALAEAPPWPAAHPDGMRMPAPIAGGTHHALDAPASLVHGLQALAAQCLQARFEGCSVWWRHDEATHMPSARVVTGLPDPALFAHMLQS